MVSSAGAGRSSYDNHTRVLMDAIFQEVELSTKFLWFLWKLRLVITADSYEATRRAMNQRYYLKRAEIDKRRFRGVSI